jgi:hypothetical protein
MLITQISLVIIGINASGANSSNFFGAMLVNTHQGRVLQISLVGAAGLMQQMRSIHFFGPQVGTRATNANNSNFFGFKAGNVATNADNSNFFGQNTGSGATNAYGSNFLVLMLVIMQ